MRATKLRHAPTEGARCAGLADDSARGRNETFDPRTVAAPYSTLQVSGLVHGLVPFWIVPAARARTPQVPVFANFHFRSATIVELTASSWQREEFRP